MKLARHSEGRTHIFQGILSVPKKPGDVLDWSLNGVPVAVIKDDVL
jgi:hypothetical protein